MKKEKSMKVGYRDYNLNINDCVDKNDVEYDKMNIEKIILRVEKEDEKELKGFKLRYTNIIYNKVIKDSKDINFAWVILSYKNMSI